MTEEEFVEKLKRNKRKDMSNKINHFLFLNTLLNEVYRINKIIFLILKYKRKTVNQDVHKIT